MLAVDHLMRSPVDSRSEGSFSGSVRARILIRDMRIRYSECRMKGPSSTLVHLQPPRWDSSSYGTSFAKVSLGKLITCGHNRLALVPNDGNFYRKGPKTGGRDSNLIRIAFERCGSFEKAPEERRRAPSSTWSINSRQKCLVRCANRNSGCICLPIKSHEFLE